MSDTQEKKKGLAVRQFGLRMHMNCENEGILVRGGFLDYPGHELDGKEVFQTITTPKTNGQWGKGVSTFHVDDGTKEPPVFNSVILLMDHYKLKSVER